MNSQGRVRVERDLLNKCLMAAVKVNNASLVDSLLAAGASADSNHGAALIMSFRYASDDITQRLRATMSPVVLGEIDLLKNEYQQQSPGMPAIR